MPPLSPAEDDSMASAPEAINGPIWSLAMAILRVPRNSSISL
jgi:hypothetical protein